MKRLLLILILGTLTALPANSQIWISFNWGDPDCGVCLNMEQALGLSYAQSLNYTQVVHEYGRRIQQAALRDYRYWDNSAREIYDLRMERDRIMQDILSPDQYYYYIDLIREDPGRIHDYAGWYTNPRYSRYTPSYLCFQYEDAYWHYHWYRNNGRWIGAFDNIFARPGSYQGRRYMSDPWRRDGYNDNYRNGKIYGYSRNYNNGRYNDNDGYAPNNGRNGYNSNNNGRFGSNSNNGRFGSGSNNGRNGYNGYNSNSNSNRYGNNGYNGNSNRNDNFGNSNSGNYNGRSNGNSGFNNDNNSNLRNNNSGSTRGGSSNYNSGSSYNGRGSMGTYTPRYNGSESNSIGGNSGSYGNSGRQNMTRGNAPSQPSNSQMRSGSDNSRGGGFGRESQSRQQQQAPTMSGSRREAQQSSGPSNSRMRRDRNF